MIGTRALVTKHNQEEVYVHSFDELYNMSEFIFIQIGREEEFMELHELTDLFPTGQDFLVHKGPHTSAAYPVEAIRLSINELSNSVPVNYTGGLFYNGKFYTIPKIDSTGFYGGDYQAYKKVKKEWAMAILEHIHNANKEEVIPSEGYTDEESRAWNYVLSAQLTKCMDEFPEIWKDGFEKVSKLYQNPVNLEDISIPHWRIVPINGKAPTEVFFDRLSKSIFNVNLYLRKWDERDYLPTRCRWHDSFGHLPYLFDNEYSEVLRLFGMSSKLLKKLDTLEKLYWFTIEFGVMAGVPFGAGILSSPEETRRVLNWEGEYKELTVENLRDTEYVDETVQPVYFEFGTLQDIKNIIIELIKEEYECN